MTRGRLTLKFCKWFENTRFKILRQRDELHLSDNPTGTALADLVGDNSVGATRALGARLTKRRTLAVLELAECAFP